jgi:hypothetical protein
MAYAHDDTRERDLTSAIPKSYARTGAGTVDFPAPGSVVTAGLRVSVTDSPAAVDDHGKVS